MIKYLTTLLWNSRKRFLGIVSEQALVYIVLTFCMVSLFDAIRQYREPGLLHTEDVVLIDFMAPSLRSQQDLDKCKEINKAIDAGIANIKQWNNVIDVSESSSLVPYLRETENYMTDSVTISGRKFNVQVKWADVAAQNVFDIRMEEGEWLPVLPNGAKPAVISRQLADQVGSDHSLIGTQVFDRNNMPYTITGIVSGIKSNVFDAALPCIIVPFTRFDRAIYREICVRVKPGQLNEFCNGAYHEFKRLVPNFNNIEFLVRDMQVFKEKNMFSVASRLKLSFIPTIFLLIFAFIGALGLLMLNVKKRAKEFGIHRAIGATSKKLQWWMVAQSLFLTLIASIPGIILSLCVFSITVTSLLAILTSLVTMLVFSFISSYYPAWQVTKINPAIVLHQD